jgi:Tol biopolymer transport system component
MSVKIPKLLIALAVLSMPAAGDAQTFTKLKGDYLGQKPPGGSAVLFAPDVVSVNGRYEYGVAFSPEGDELFFSAEYPGEGENDGPQGLLVTRRVDGQWTAPVVADLRGEGSWEQEAFYTVDGGRLFFATNISDRETKLWLAERTKKGWSEARQLDSPANTTANRVFYATFTRDGTMYYTNVDERKVYRAKLVDGGYPAVEVVDVPGGHAFVAPDESFLLLDSGGDIQIAYRLDGGGWTKPVKLDGGISSEFYESCPSLSPDGKYLFFSRYNEPGELSNIYWARGDIIESNRPASTD